MTVGSPAWLAASAGDPAYDATELRVIDTLYATYDGAVLGGREGVRPGGNSLAVSVSGSPLNWNVAPGICAVSGITSGVLGMYVVPVTATESGVLTAADATFARKDILVLKVTDAEAGDSTRKAEVVYLVGTPAATPSAPAVPAKSFLIATIDVPKTGSGSPAVTQNSKYTVASGGILPTASRPASPYAGMTIFNTVSGIMEYYTGIAWAPLSAGSAVVLIQTVAGTANWTKPANAKSVHVRLWGGGGAGGGTTGGSGQAEGGGGGGGGYTEKMYAASDLNATESFTVGAGGTGVALGNGNAGGASTFKGLTANGGGGGGSIIASPTIARGLRGAGGTATGGDLNCAGDDGGNGFAINGNAAFTGFGGASPSGGGITQQTDFAQSNGTAGSSPGGGGTGSFSGGSGFAGGAGAAGKILITTYF